jgi:hypothetical protein
MKLFLFALLFSCKKIIKHLESNFIIQGGILNDIELFKPDLEVSIEYLTKYNNECKHLLITDVKLHLLLKIIKNRP